MPSMSQGQPMLIRDEKQREMKAGS